MTLDAWLEHYARQPGYTIKMQWQGKVLHYVVYADRHRISGGEEKKMNINTLFRIADAAKHIQAYDIANAIFAVIAAEAIKSKAFGGVAEPNPEAVRVHFQIEMEGDDLIESLAYPNTVGYYDLPRLTKYGERQMGGPYEAFALCIPLPLVSRYFCNMLVRLMDRESHNMGGGILDRPPHERKYWRLSAEKTEACRRDLWRRLYEEVAPEEVESSKLLILAQSEPEYEEYSAPIASEDEAQWLGPATIARLKAAAEDFESLVVEDYAD